MISFSVLLSVYYKESPIYLSQALYSVIKQSIPPTEIILVEDGKLPKTLEKVISQFKKKTSTIKIVQLPYNQGLGKALNEGLKHCTYDIVARMDTDDIAKLDRFEKQIKIFEKYPDIDICSAWIEEFENDTNNILSIKKLPERHQVGRQPDHSGRHRTVHHHRVPGGRRPVRGGAGQRRQGVQSDHRGLHHLPRGRHRQPAHAVADARLRRGFPQYGRVSVLHSPGDGGRC